MSDPVKMTVSVVTLAWPPGQSRPRNVFTFLASLPAGLDWAGLEVIVLCNGRDPILADRLRADSRVNIVLMSDENLGVATGWNRAAAAAHGDILVLANEDAVLGPSVLRGLTAPLHGDARIGLTGVNGSLWSVDLVRPLRGRELSSDAARKAAVVVPAGYLMAVRRSAWIEIGGVDDKLSPAFYEEVDLAFRMAAASLKMVSVDGLTVQHDFGVSAFGRRRRLAWSGRSATSGAIHRRNHRQMTRTWSSQPWRGTWAGHMVVYWLGIARWRASHVAGASLKRLRALTHWARRHSCMRSRKHDT